MKQPRGHPYRIAVAIPLAGAILLASTYVSPAQEADSAQRLLRINDSMLVRARALSIIAHNYIDSITVDSSLSIQEIVNRLDPFTYYQTKAEYDRFVRQVDDEEFAFGIHIREVLKHFLLTSIAFGSPAENVGILPGDEILAVGGKKVGGNDSIMRSLLAGKDEATFHLYRASNDSTWSVAVRKAQYEHTSVPVAAMIDSQIGYIEMTGFHSGTAAKLQKAIEYLRRKGMLSLILDLRYNGGGFVSECLKAANLFIHSEGQTVIQNSRVASQIRQYSLNCIAPYPTMPLVVLVGNSSASAAEMFTGILQDLDRATVVGQPTIGKSLVMQCFTLPNQDRLYLAVAYYMLPSGRSVQRPYTNGKLIGGWDRDFGSFDNSRHVFDSEVSETECPTYRTASGRSVIPFSGIVPDYFVSQEYFYPEWMSDAVEGAAALYLSENSDWLFNITIDSFENHYQIPRAFVEWALDSIRAHDTTADKFLSAQLAWAVPRLIKANVAYGTWGGYGFFKLWRRNTATVRRAAGLLSKPATLALVGK
jgi:carboxyl-terminal processing protease